MLLLDHTHYQNTCLGLGGGGVGGDGCELSLRAGVDDEESTVSLLQELHQNHGVLILTHHLGPLVIFLHTQNR